MTAHTRNIYRELIGLVAKFSQTRVESDRVWMARKIAFDVACFANTPGDKATATPIT